MILLWLCCLVVSTVTRAHHLHKRHVDDNLCDHPECTDYAATIASGMDTTQNPCEDFWKFACGNYPNDVPNFYSIPQLDGLTIQSITIRNKLLALLYTHAQDDDAEVVKKSKEMFDSCVNADHQHNIAALRDFVESLGGWPLGSTDTFGWNDVMEYMMKLLPLRATPMPFKIGVVSLPQMNVLSYPLLQQPDPGKDFLPDDYPSEQVVALASVLDFIAYTDPRADEDAQQMLGMKQDFEKFIISTTSFPLISIADLNDKTQTDWLPLLNQVFAGIQNLTYDNTVGVNTPEFLNELVSYASTSQGAKNVINYMIFKAAYDLYGSFQLDDNTKAGKCLDQVLTCFGDALEWEYGKKYHQIDKEREMVNEMATLIADSLDKRLAILSWLDEPSRQAAIDKLHNVRKYYEYASWLDDLDKLTEHYAKFDVTDSIVKNNVECSADARKDVLHDLVLPPQQRRWPESSLQANAFYMPSQNNIRILEGILEMPEYALNRLRIMNFADLGYVIGHEIVHGFDTTGVEFDANGNLAPWLSTESQSKFDEKTRCLINQYDSYVLKENPYQPDLTYKVDGSNTIGENIADQGGLRLAYDAYQEYKQQKGSEVMPQVLTDMNFTEPQIFFLAFAHNYCANYASMVNGEQIKNSFAADPHSPDKFRVNGPLSNFKEFIEVFQCPSGSPMNRGEEAMENCNIW